MPSSCWQWRLITTNTYWIKTSNILSVSYPSIFTRAGIPPDLKIARSPSRWWERLCNVPAEQRAVSTSPVFCMARTTAETICGERIRAWRDASFFDNWCTITAALFTTTYQQRQCSVSMYGLGTDTVLSDTICICLAIQLWIYMNMPVKLFTGHAINWVPLHCLNVFM